ncbi:MAG: DNRLRE domain-containing protein [Myxococcales bacterium]
MTSSLLPEADVYVRSGIYANQNFGSATSILVGLNQSGTTAGGALRFTVGALDGPVTSARLRLYITDGSTSSAEVWTFSSTTWGETTTTWNNRPAVDGTRIALVGVTSPSTFVEVDVTSVVRASSVLSLAFVPRSSDLFAFNSREASTNQPTLVIQTATPVDAGVPGPDAAQPGPDAAQPGPDAAQPGPDAAQPGPDAAVFPPTIGVVGVMTRVRPDQPTPPLAVGAVISAARNEFESFQIVIVGPATNVSVTPSALTGPATIPAADVRPYQEAVVTLSEPSSVDSTAATFPARFPDALVPGIDEFVGETRNGFPFSVLPGETRAIWVDVYVPLGTPFGVYTGQVVVTSQEATATVPVSLTVWDFELPQNASLRTAFGFDYGAILSPTGHAIPFADARWFPLRQRYGRLALDHRISLSVIDDGFDDDMAHFNTWYGPLLDGTAGTTEPNASLRSVQALGNLSTWATDFKAHGWFDRLFQYTCDEPPRRCAWSDIPARASAAHGVDPSFRTLVTTTIQSADANGVTTSINIFVPLINFLDDKPVAEGGIATYVGNQRAKYDAFLAANPINEIWTYQSCMSYGCETTEPYATGWPSYMIDASPLRNRAEEWLSWSLRLSGELYSDTVLNYSAQDPWVDPLAHLEGGNGEGTLFYPGRPNKIGGATHIPVASIRLKMIREGQEDYEYLKLCASLGAPDLSNFLASDLFPHPYQLDTNPQHPGRDQAATLMSYREQLAQRIVCLKGSPQCQGTPALAITQGPAVSGITGAAATITWATNQASSTVVHYGPTASYGSTTTGSGDSLAHSVALSGLSPDTSYHFQAVSSNAGGTASSADQTFTTLPSAAPDFALSATPSSRSTAAGGGASYAVTVTPLNGFSGSVTLSAGGLPSGALASFSPNPTATSATMTVTTSATGATGAFTLTISGTSGALAHTATTLLTVLPPAVVTNGDFEAGDLTGWTLSAGNPPQVVTTARSGAFAAQVGSSLSSGTESTLSQAITVPAAGGTLSFWYYPHCTGGVSVAWQQFQLRSSTGAVLVSSRICSNSQVWTPATLNLGAWAGQSVVLWFTAHDDNVVGSQTWLWLDDVQVQ